MRITRSAIFAMLVVLAGFFITQPAFAYTFNFQALCPNGSRWSQNRLPVQYYIHELGSDDLPIQSVEAIIGRAFNAWEAPCCSAFSANYAGQTSLPAENITDKVVLSFEENRWPTQLGSAEQLIAVTIIYLNTDCTVYKAPILFNGVTFDFCDGGSGCTDLASIATHEIGHNLGLDHSGAQGATMSAIYEGGTDMRSLTQDDIDGVCALYPSDTCACTQASDCGPNQVCTAGQCETRECAEDDDCAAWQQCDLSSGACVVPSCSDDQDCEPGFQCDAHNQCVTSCAVCRRCRSNIDCGTDGLCVDGACLIACAADTSCPEDARCFQFAKQGGFASSGACADSDSCEPGEQCYPDGEGGGVCATPCSSDGHCESDQKCMGVSQKFCVDITLRCLNPDAGSRGTCYQNYICESAVLDPCVGMVCPSGQACEGAGECVDRPESDAGYPEDTVGPDAVDAPPDIAQTESDTFESPVDIAEPDGRDKKPLDPAATDEPQHIYLRSEGCACSSSPVQDEAPASLMLLGAFGLGILWRRRR